MLVMTQDCTEQTRECFTQHKPETDYRNKAIGVAIKEKHLGSDCSQVPSLHLLAIYPGVVYQWDTICRCGRPLRWQAEEGFGVGRKHCGPSHYSSRQHYTQPGIKDTNMKHSQLIHPPHPEKSAEGFMRKAAGLSRTFCFYNKLYFKVSS